MIMQTHLRSKYVVLLMTSLRQPISCWRASCLGSSTRKNQGMKPVSNLHDCLKEDMNVYF